MFACDARASSRQVKGGMAAHWLRRGALGALAALASLATASSPTAAAASAALLQPGPCTLTFYNPRICHTWSKRAREIYTDLRIQDLVLLLGTTDRQSFFVADAEWKQWQHQQIGTFHVFSYGYPYSKLSARCIPIIGIDLNDRVSKHRVGHKDFSNTCDQCSKIGTFAQDKEGITAHSFRQVAMKHGLVCANTFHKSHATFYGSGFRSIIVFVLVPKSILAQVTKCHTLHGMANRLSSINTRQLRDHALFLRQWRFFSAADAKKDIAWDKNKSMQALQGDFRIRYGFAFQFNMQIRQTMDHGEFWHHLLDSLTTCVSPQIASNFVMCSFSNSKG